MKYCLLILLCCVVPAQAKGTFSEYLNSLFVDAKAQGISSETIARVKPTIHYRETVVKSDANQPERRLTLDSYLTTRVPDWKVAQAIEHYQTHEALLNKVASTFKVQPRFIVALWGNESNFGRIQGKHPVLSSLASLAYEGRRESLFKKQFMAALEMVQSGAVEPEQFLGSWAGAMGQTQFMPENFLAYAVDFDQDGKTDIWQSHADVFASIANFLVKHGWNNKHTWGRQVKLTSSVKPELVGLGKAKAQQLSRWKQHGVVRFNGSNLPNVDIPAWLLMPDGASGRQYLVYDNFQTLMRWNRSSYFGLSVAYLSERINKGMR